MPYPQLYFSSATRPGGFAPFPATTRKVLDSTQLSLYVNQPDWNTNGDRPEELEMTKEEISLVELRVNDKEVEINSFVQGVIRNIVMGLISSLRLDGEAKTIELKITSP
jgi:hypothetical protein